MPSKPSNTLPIAGVASIAVAAAALVFTHDVPYLETRPTQNHNAMYDLTALEQVDARHIAVFDAAVLPINDVSFDPQWSFSSNRPDLRSSPGVLKK